MDMLGSFRVRMLAVIIIVFLTGISLESGHNSKQYLEPTIKFILKDYGFNNKISIYIENLKPTKTNGTVPVSSSSVLQVPCKFTAVERNYGWYYNQDSRQQEFLPGVYLKVENNTIVKPILAGYIEEIGQDENGRTIMIRHDRDFYSFYGGFKEVLVERDAQVDNNTILGKTGELFYLEIKNNDGPVNPHNLINADS
jgi:murein DD-endopeptidase MepM/ murein hydrolase activator NlpD